MAVTVPAVVTMMNSVATMKPVTGFRSRCKESESDDKCCKGEKTRHESDPSWEVEKVMRSSRISLKSHSVCQTEITGDFCRRRGEGALTLMSARI